MAKVAKKTVGRPRKAEPHKFTTINIPTDVKKELEVIKEKLEKEIGFSVSLADATRYLIKHYNLRKVK